MGYSRGGGGEGEERGSGSVDFLEFADEVWVV